MKIELTNFVKRQWNTTFAGTKMSEIEQEPFIEYINAQFSIYRKINENDSDRLVKFNDFCSYFFYENIYSSVKTSVIKIDHSIYPYIQTGYNYRTKDELHVLNRWVTFPPNSFELPKAKYIGLVLYSREQLLKEHIEQESPSDKFELSDDCKYGIVAIMGLNAQEMDPMIPITQFRNAIGITEGGNGQRINKQEYMKSVEFWSKHILVK